MTFLGDARDGDNLVILPEFYRVTGCKWLVAIDFDSSFHVGTESAAGFLRDDNQTAAMLRVFRGNEQNAATMRTIAEWLRDHQ